MHGRFAAGPVSVRPEADVLADCAREKACKCQPSRAADGIRTHDLLHGKQFVGLAAWLNVPANLLLLPRETASPMSQIHREMPGVSRVSAGWCVSLGFHADSREFED